MANIHDVAKKAGVSISTVSLVLNGSPLVKEETRKRVQSVVQIMGYVPNNDARSLRQRMTNNLGIIYMSENEENMFYGDYSDNHTAGLCSMSIVNGIMQSITGTRYGIVSERFCARSSEEGSLPQIIKSKRVDGVFIVASPYASHLIGNLQKLSIPFVIVGVDCFAPGVDSFYADSGEATAMALSYLSELGHKNICLINSNNVFMSGFSRKKAFEETSKKLNLNLPSQWEIACETNCGRSSYQAFRAYWEAGNRPDGIIAGNGYMAIGAMRYLHEQGVRIPKDVSIVSCEDSVLSGYAIPRLTSINIGKEELGRCAAKGLIDRINNPSKEPEWYTQPPYLVRRDSVLDRRNS